MITRIQNTDFKHTNDYQCSCPKPKPNKDLQNNGTPQTSFNPKMLQSYFVNFTGKDDNSLKYTNSATHFQKQAIELAKKYGNKDIISWHIIYNNLAETVDFINALGDKTFNEDKLAQESSPKYFINTYSDEIFKNTEYRKSIKTLFEQYLDRLDEKLDSLPKDLNKKETPKFSDELNNDILMIKGSLEELDDTAAMIDKHDILNGAYFSSQDEEIIQFSLDLDLAIKSIYKLEDKSANSKRLHFQNYDKIAENVFKNLNMNTNMFVTYDSSKIDPNFFVPSIAKTLEKIKGPLNASNTEIVEFNKNVDMKFFTDILNLLAQNKDKNYILLFSQDKLLLNTQGSSSSDGTKYVEYTEEYVDAFDKTPKNIKLIIFEQKDNYLMHSQSSKLLNIYNYTGEISIPTLNQDDVLKSVINNEKFFEDNKMNFSKKAIKKVVETSAQLEGKFPDKTINLFKKIARYYADKKEIKLNDVENYIKNSEYLFRQIDSGNSFEIVFDTGKHLNDIVGKSNTKQEAENIIRQIKSNKMGTKGFIIYSQDGSIGAGRRHTAEVIAGETKVPFVSINTMDFGTEKVDLFGGTSMSPEASIKKLFSTVTTQAETNPHKSAVLFIENFEYFSVGEMVSEYHQKAMAQLIREMQNADKKGFNIAVIGSVSDPSLIGNTTAKSSKFNDEIEVSSPSVNYKERFEILEHASKHNKLPLAGTPKEQQKTIMKFAKFLDGASFIELKNFMQKSESVAQERNHKEITLADMTESFMRMTTGRVNMQPVSSYEKEIVTKHECGHAINITVMNNLLKNTGKPWTIPSEVNFITLDPRGYYGGAVYSDDDENKEYSFEKMFSDIVLSYGGNSVENYFYDMPGSLGVTADIEHATKTAMMMVKNFGQGYNAGRINIDNLSGMIGNGITDELKSDVMKDIKAITRNALLVSDLIVENYADFIDEFSDKYSKRVGTGECLIDGDEFRQELEQWKSKQSDKKLQELKFLDNMILEIIAKSKKSQLY